VEFDASEPLETEMQKRLTAFREKTQEQDQLIDEIAIYQRKKDPAVNSFIKEYQKPPTKKEHKGKWMKKGDSPTKRLMGKPL
jgi:hypothetical protein